MVVVVVVVVVVAVVGATIATVNISRYCFFFLLIYFLAVNRLRPRYE